MLSSVLGLFSQDLAVDLGTSTVRLYLSAAGARPDPGSEGPVPGTLCAAPTAVAVHTDRKGRRQVLAIGADVLPMIGRTPDDLRVVRPFHRGLVADPEAAEKMLLHLVRRVHGRNGWLRPRMFVAVPHGASPEQLEQVRALCEAVGGREVRLVPRPIAAGLGAQVPIHEPSGTLIVDVGASGTEVSVLSLGGIVSSTTVEGGGDGMDQAIVDWLAQERELLIGLHTAENLKLAIGYAADADPDLQAIVKGRCLRSGVPRGEVVTATDLVPVLAQSVEPIAAAIRAALAAAPPELAADVVEGGVVLTGGAAVLRGFDRALHDRTALPVACCDAPDRAVVHGVGRVLDERAVVPAVGSTALLEPR